MGKKTRDLPRPRPPPPPRPPRKSIKLRRISTEVFRFYLGFTWSTHSFGLDYLIINLKQIC